MGKGSEVRVGLVNTVFASHVVQPYIVLCSAAIGSINKTVVVHKLCLSSGGCCHHIVPSLTLTVFNIRAEHVCVLHVWCNVLLTLFL